MPGLNQIAARRTIFGLAAPYLQPHRHLVASVTAAAAALACAPAALAVVPPTAMRSTPVLTDDGSSLGTAQFETVFEDTGATATASASALHLRKAGTFLIRSCVWYKATAVAPQSVCESKHVTFGGFAGRSGIAAPQAQMHIERPAAGQPAATIAGTVLVEELGGEASSSPASSWPRDGMRVAGVAVPAVDQTTGEILGAQGVPLDGVRPGGIDTFAQDSICREREVPQQSAPRGSVQALGSLPFPYEVQEPPGNPRGTILILHGGAWFMTGRGALETNRGEADRWLSRGWRTVVSSYRACSSSSEDVATLFDRVQEIYGASRPVCASGQSAGAHLALLLAAVRPGLACVVAQAGPADLTALAEQTAPDLAGLRTHVGPRRVANMAIAAFGADRLATLSPALRSVGARVLFAIGEGDILIPWEQATGFAAAQSARDPGAYVDTLRLSAGDIPWIHARVSRGALDDLDAHEKTLVAPLTATTLRVSTSVRSNALKRHGLPVGYSCPSACRVSIRLRRGARRIGRARGRRATFGSGKVTIRLSARERERLAHGKLNLVVDVRTDDDATRTRRSVRIR